MPFVNHDSYNSKFREKFFLHNISEKNQRIYGKILKNFEGNQQKVRLYNRLWICHLRQFSTGLRLSLRGELIYLMR
jgi:hypothetical protein